MGKVAVTEQQVIDRVSDICNKVANGMTLRQIAFEYGVDPATILNWVTVDTDSTQQYARAREAAADLFESGIIEAAESVTPETAAADRVKIDALKWVAARRAPKKYGDKVQQEITGANGGPVQMQNVSELTDEQLLLIANANTG